MGQSEDLFVTSYVSVSTAAYDGYGFDRILRSLARCGVRHVEFAFIEGYVQAFTDTDFTNHFANELKMQMKRQGQECRYFSGHIDLGGEDATERLEARCRFAADLGASYVITNAATLERSDPFFRKVDAFASIARKYDVRILLENPGNGVPNLFDHAGDAPDLLKRLDRHAFGINYDVGNLLSHCPDRDLVSDAYQAMNIADHFHLKPCIRALNGIDFVSLGEGSVSDFEVAAELLRKKKPFSLELPFRLHRDANAQPWRDAEPVPLELIESRVGGSLAELSLLSEQL